MLQGSSHVAASLISKWNYMKKHLFSLVVVLLLFMLPGTLLAAAKKKHSPTPDNSESSPVLRPPAQLSALKHWSTPDYTRISLELDRDVTWESHKLGRANDGSPERVYIDLHRTRIAATIKDITIGDGLLKGARVAQYKANTVRVVLDIESMKDFKVFSLSEPSRLVIDVRGDRLPGISRLEPSLKAAPEAVAPTLPEAEQGAEKRRVEKKSLDKKTVDKKTGAAKRTGTAIAKVRRIVVDPGHGGHDPGAIGSGGTREKDIVLSIGLKLKELLEDDLGLDVVMTRSTDVFIPLEERTAIANKVGADLFVSVHANAAANRSAAGIETYYLNLAKTDKVAHLAAKENGTSLEKVSVLQAILFDLMANYKLNDSAHLAEEVQKSLHKKVRSEFGETKNLGVKQGPFYVLVGATMPSILVETAFLSNHTEEARLNDPAYQDATAEGIMEGVRTYINSLK